MEKKPTKPTKAAPKEVQKPDPNSRKGKPRPVPIPASEVQIPPVEVTTSDFPGCNPKQSWFVREYMKDMNATQAAIRSGYSEKTATWIGPQLLVKTHVAAAIESEKSKRSERLQIDVDGLVKKWQKQFEADHNDLTQYRRVPCRHCWGIEHAYQYTPGEFQKAVIRHEEKRAELLGKSGGKSDIGEFPGIKGDWYDKRRDPHPDCPDCFGEGLGETFFADTRKLSANGKAIYAGVKETKDGIEIKTVSTEKAGEYLARHLGAFNDKMEIEVTEKSPEAMKAKYDSLKEKAKDRMAVILAERGLTRD